MDLLKSLGVYVAIALAIWWAWSNSVDAEVDQRVAVANEERAKVNKGWEEYARQEAEAADGRVAAAESARDAALADLAKQRGKNVTPKTVAGCTVTAGLVLQHNDAALGRAGVSPAAPFDADRPAGIGIDRYSAVVESNYTGCNKTADRLRELQRWAVNTCNEWNQRYGHAERCQLPAANPRGNVGQP